MSNTQFRAVTVAPDGEVQEVLWDVSNGTLEHLQRAVGGLVDVVSLTPKLDMWVNDEGLVQGLEVNQVATVVARACGVTWQHYVGTAVFTHGLDADGETLSMTAEEASALMNMLHLAAAASRRPP